MALVSEMWTGGISSDKLARRVQAFIGDVQLSNFVASSKATKRAADIARNVEGVDSIKNNLPVK